MHRGEGTLPAHRNAANGQGPERTELDALNEVVTLLGRDFNRARLYDRIARDADVGLGKNLLYLLSRAAEQQPVRLADLARELEVDRTSVSRSMQSLVSLGLTRRHVDPDDARALSFTVTPAGEAVLARTWSAWNRILASLLADWSADERAELVRLLGRLAYSLDDLIWSEEEPSAGAR
jgi:DNA-binding MarR family transcriptional regulator